MTGKGSFTFLSTLIRANSLIIKNVTRSFVVLNAMIENENRSFSNILNFFLGSWPKIMVHVERYRNNRKTFVFVFRCSIYQDETSTNTSS